MKVLVVGGTGYVGGAITLELARRGHEVTVYHRGERERPDLPEVRHVHGDQRDVEALRRLRGRVDAVVSVAPVNERDTVPLVGAFASAIQTSVHLSSCDVYRAWQAVLDGTVTDPVPLGEDAPLRETLYPYRNRGGALAEYDKIPAERATLGAAHFPAAVLRLAVVYGPGDPQRREWPFIRRLRAGRTFIPMGGGAEWLWHRVYVDDVASAAAAVLERPEAMGRAYNVGERGVWTMRQLALEVAAAMGRECDVRSVPDEGLPEGLRLLRTHPQHLLVDTAAIRALGWSESLPMQEALRRTVEWHLAHPPEDDAAEDEA